MDGSQSTYVDMYSTNHLCEHIFRHDAFWTLFIARISWCKSNVPKCKHTPCATDWTMARICAKSSRLIMLKLSLHSDAMSESITLLGRGQNAHTCPDTWDAAWLPSICIFSLMSLDTFILGIKKSYHCKHTAWYSYLSCTPTCLSPVLLYRYLCFRAMTMKVVP